MRSTPACYDSEFDARGESIVVARSGLAAPVELYAVDETASLQPLTRHNQALLSSLDLAKPSRSRSQARGGTEVQGFLVRPPAFDASKKYPVLMLLHGGPQTQWGDTWSYRWNAQTFAAPGYVIVMINRRGSTGFGQKFTDEIALDWGGKPFEDLMKGLDFVPREICIHRSRSASRPPARSYGGYMIDWLASHAKGRFRALVSHAGVYNLTSMYGSTEELWFPEHDFGGMPWTNPPDLREAVAAHLRGGIRQVQDADARHCRRAGLPRAVHTKPRVLHGAAASGRAFEAGRVPRRRTLDPETAEQPALVQRSARLARQIPGQVAGRDQTI